MRRPSSQGPKRQSKTYESSCRRVVVSSWLWGVAGAASKHIAPGRAATCPAASPSHLRDPEHHRPARRRGARQEGTPGARSAPGRAAGLRKRPAARVDLVPAGRGAGERRARRAGHGLRAAARSEPAGQPGDDGVRQADGWASVVPAGRHGLPRQQRGEQCLGVGLDHRPASLPAPGVHAGSVCAAAGSLESDGHDVGCGRLAFGRGLVAGTALTAVVGRGRRVAAGGGGFCRRFQRRREQLRHRVGQRRGRDGSRRRQHPPFHQQHPTPAAGAVLALSAAWPREEPKPPDGSQDAALLFRGTRRSEKPRRGLQDDDQRGQSRQRHRVLDRRARVVVGARFRRHARPAAAGRAHQPAADGQARRRLRSASTR